MITLAMAVNVEAARDAVWRALTDPAQVPRWRPGVLAALDPAPLPPAVGRVRRWRFRLHDLPLVLVEEALEVAPPSRLRTCQRLGLFVFDQVVSLRPAGPSTRHTRCAIRIATHGPIAVVGGSLDRFGVQRFATRLAATTLEALRDWCERDRPPVPAGDRRLKAVAAHA